MQPRAHHAVQSAAIRCMPGPASEPLGVEPFVHHRKLRSAHRPVAVFVVTNVYALGDLELSRVWPLELNSVRYPALAHDW